MGSTADDLSSPTGAEGRESLENAFTSSRLSTPWLHTQYACPDETLAAIAALEVLQLDDAKGGSKGPPLPCQLTGDLHTPF